jgi:hypothetical protein
MDPRNKSGDDKKKLVIPAKAGIHLSAYGLFGAPLLAASASRAGADSQPRFVIPAGAGLGIAFIGIIAERLIGAWALRRKRQLGLAV